MTRVDFYILQDVDLDAMRRFACRLAGKAVTGGHEVHIHTDGAEDAGIVDELLWSYPDNRFIPHETLDDSGRAPVAAPVTLGWAEPDGLDGVLINLSEEIPRFFGRFDRVAEVIPRSRRDAGRERYKFYRDRGYPLFHHELDDWEA
jgi:DNA polymerase-3 subunit chi